MSDKRATPDLLAGRLADSQHGVVSTRQLLAAGLDKHAVHHRVRTGRLCRIHRGVYSLGHSALSKEARWMAAILACGRSRVTSGAVLDYWGAALSHRSAACLWGLLSSRNDPVDVSIAGDGGRHRRRGIRLHRSTTLISAEVTLREGIPVTTVTRTIADLHRASAGVSPLLAPAEFRRAIRQADVLGLPVESETARDRTRSDLERDFLEMCGRHGLPAPEVNVRVGCHLVDFLWRDRMLVVETDGYRYHRGRAAFEDDRSRDVELRELGYETIRFTGAQVTGEPERLARLLSVALSERRRDGGNAAAKAP